MLMRAASDSTSDSALMGSVMPHWKKNGSPTSEGLLGTAMIDVALPKPSVLPDNWASPDACTKQPGAPNGPRSIGSELPAQVVSDRPKLSSVAALGRA